MALTVFSTVATPNRLALVIRATGAETANLKVATLRGYVTAGTPLDTALASSLGTCDTTNAKAQAALITGGSYTNTAVTPNASVQTFINVRTTNGLAAGPGSPVAVGVCAIATATNPTLQISTSAATANDQEPVVFVEQIHSVIR